MEHRLTQVLLVVASGCFDFQVSARQKNWAELSLLDLNGGKEWRLAGERSLFLVSHSSSHYCSTTLLHSDHQLRELLQVCSSTTTCRGCRACANFLFWVMAMEEKNSGKETLTFFITTFFMAISGKSLAMFWYKKTNHNLSKLVSDQTVSSHLSR